MNKTTIDCFIELHNKKRKSLGYYLEKHGARSVIGRDFRHSWSSRGPLPLYGPGDFEPITIKDFRIVNYQPLKWLASLFIEDSFTIAGKEESSLRGLIPNPKYLIIFFAEFGSLFKLNPQL